MRVAFRTLKSKPSQQLDAMRSRSDAHTEYAEDEITVPIVAPTSVLTGPNEAAIG